MAIDIDGVLQAIGETGPYQRRIYFFLCLPVIFVGAANFAYVFIAATPRYRCFVKGCDSVDNAVYDAPFINFSIPWKNKTQEFDSCYQYKRNDSYPTSECVGEDFTEITESCDSGILFDTSVFESTIVSEFNLTCQSSWQASADQSIYFVGILVGCFVFGIMSDSFGRRLTILVCIIFLSISGVVIALVPNIYSFHVMRFFNAMASAGLFQTSFILGMEFVGPSKRVMFGVVGEYFFAFGEILLGLLAWTVRSWRMLQLIISAPVICFIFYYWIVPESVRWLQTKGRHLQVVESLENIAKINKKTIPLNLLAHRSVNHDQIDDMELTHLLSSSSKISMIDIMKTPILLFRVLFLIFIWISTTLCYYGLSYSTQDIRIGDMYSSPFIFFILSAFMEVPGYTLAWVGMQYWGRKWSLVSSLLFAGVFTIGIGYLKTFVSVLSLFMIGKCFITSAFAIIYVFTAELFPTSVRNTVIGTCSMFARIGGMVAPFSNELKEIYLPLPMLVFGVISILSGLLGLAMPETKDTKLPDTLSDAINIGKKDDYMVVRGSQSERLLSEDENLINNVSEQEDLSTHNDSDDAILNN